MTRLVRAAALAAVVLGLHAPGWAQAPAATPADVERVQTRIDDVRDQVAQLPPDAQLRRELSAQLDELNDQAIALKARVQKERVSPAVVDDLMGQLAGIDDQARRALKAPPAPPMAAPAAAPAGAAPPVAPAAAPVYAPASAPPPAGAVRPVGAPEPPPPPPGAMPRAMAPEPPPPPPATATPRAIAPEPPPPPPAALQVPVPEPPPPPPGWGAAPTAAPAPATGPATRAVSAPEPPPPPPVTRSVAPPPAVVTRPDERAPGPGLGGELPAGTELDARLVAQLSSKTAQVEDRFEAATLVDLFEGSRLVVPAGSRMRGIVSGVERPGRLDRKGSLTLTFDQLTVRGAAYPVRGTVVQTIESQGVKADASRIGVGAGVGAIIGGILAGPQGAAAGVFIGTGGVLAALPGKDLDLPTGTIVRVRFETPVVFR
jgi:hypothetical protein